MTTLSIELPESAFFALRKAPQKFLQEMRLAAAVKWYESGALSESQAAEVAGVSPAELQQAKQRYGGDGDRYPS